jgi:hypothetical protein
MHSDDVRHLLQHGAARPSRDLDVGGIMREGRRLKRQRVIAIASGAAVVVLVAMLSTNVGLVMDFRPNPPRPVTSPAPSAGWSELPTPPKPRAGAALVWAGSELLAWGGCTAPADEECAPSKAGVSFDPGDGKWTAIENAPRPGSSASAVWTGAEAVFLHNEGGRLEGQAYDARAGTWRTLPRAPVPARWGGAIVWTGAEVILWGGGKPGEPTTRNGAAYDPARNEWRRLADAPLGLNEFDAVWTGSEMVVFGSLLDNRNMAATKTAVGASYNPAEDVWSALPPSELSPQASAAAWIGDRVVAWDYEARSQSYDPDVDAWSAVARMPLEFSECYPDSEVVGGSVFGFYCGHAVLYDPATSKWGEIRGGPLEDELESGNASYKLWRFAELASSGDTLYVLAEGITLGDNGEVCYGCPGSPSSFWAYRPPQ